MSNLLLKRARDAIQRLHEDTSVPKQETLDNLYEIMDLVDMLTSALESEIKNET